MYFFSLSTYYRIYVGVLKPTFTPGGGYLKTKYLLSSLFNQKAYKEISETISDEVTLV